MRWALPNMPGVDTRVKAALDDLATASMSLVAQVIGLEMEVGRCRARIESLEVDREWERDLAQVSKRDSAPL